MATNIFGRAIANRPTGNTSGRPGDFTLKDLEKERLLYSETNRRQGLAYPQGGATNIYQRAIFKKVENDLLNYRRQQMGQAPVDQRGNVIGRAPNQPIAQKQPLAPPAPVPVAAPAPPPVAAAPAPAPPPPAAVAAPAPVVAAPAPVLQAVPPPVAVTDPASEISAEEQAARMRARLILSQGTNRLGRMQGLSSSQLGYRMLIGGTR